MIVIAFKNKISGKSNYLTTIDTGPCTSIIDSAMKFDKMQDATTYYMSFLVMFIHEERRA